MANAGSRAVESAPALSQPRRLSRPVPGRADPLASPRALVNAIMLSAVATLLVSLWVLRDLNGWSYYSTPLRVRGYASGHAMLRPSGLVGHSLGIAGVAMMLVPVLYQVRKRVRRFQRAGSMRAWLEVHIFCGVFGPVLVMYHTAFKFNGIISVAFWSMVLVVLSGFVGRYLYVRIPKTIRGTELTHDDIVRRAGDLKLLLSSSGIPAAALDELDAIEEGYLGRGRLRGLLLRVRLWRLRRSLVRSGAQRTTADQAVLLLKQRAYLLRRLATLERTRRLFGYWHVFHQPLVYIMFAIAALHIAVALYFGYSLL